MSSVKALQYACPAVSRNWLAFSIELVLPRAMHPSAHIGFLGPRI